MKSRLLNNNPFKLRLFLETIKEISMKVKTLNDLLADMVKDLYSAETQIIKSLPKIIKICRTKDLKSGFEKHLQETINQRERLERVAELMDINPKGKKCIAMEGLLEEADELISEVKDQDVLEVGLIAAAQKVEHYEIASYGTACTFAKMLGNNEILQLLHEILEEEKATDENFTQIAESKVNEKVMHH
jgi:ferritin-like metal-binding protein YciE